MRNPLWREGQAWGWLRNGGWLAMFWLGAFAAMGAIVLPDPPEPGTMRRWPPPVAPPPTNPPPAPLSPTIPPPVVNPPTNPAPARPRPSEPGTHQPLRLRLDLREGSSLLGVPAAAQLPVKSALGAVTVDLAQVNFIELPENKELVTLVFRNGDRVSGAIRQEGFDLKTAFGAVKIPLALVRRIQVFPGGKAVWPLLNINFAGTNKTGRAALGLGDQDYWNGYVAPFAQASSLANLKLAHGEATEIGLLVKNGGGHWGNQTGDPMYDSYVYPNSHSGNVTVTLTNLPAGRYDVYLYGYAGGRAAEGRDQSNSLFTLKCGAREYGPAGAKKSFGWKAGDPWVKGQQYVVLEDVEVMADEAVMITVSPGFDGRPTGGVAVLNGLQIAPAGAFALP